MERVTIEGLSLKNRIVNAVFWLGASKIIGQAVSWVITIYVARILSSDDYGLMGMAGVFIGFIILFNELGLGSAVIQKKNLTEDDLSNIFWLVILLNTLLYLTAFATSPFIADFFNEPRLNSLIRIASVNFVISSFGFISCNMLTREIVFNKRSQAEFIGNLAGSVSTFLFAVNGLGVWSLVYGSIILTAVTNIFFYNYYPWRPSLSFSFYKIREMFNFGLKVVIARILWYVYTNSDFLIAGKFLGKTSLGYYSLAFQFASIPLEKVVSLVTHIAFPVFSEIQNNVELLKSYFIKMVRFVAFITFPMFCGIFLVADDAVNLFLTEKWSPIVLPLKVLCIVSTLRAIYTINAPLVMAKGKPDVVILNHLIFAIFLPIVFYIGSFYGLVGLSYSWLFVFPVLFIITTHLSLRVIGFPMIEYFKELRHIFSGTIFMVMFVIVIQKAMLDDLGHLGRISGTSLAGVLSYLLYYLLFNREIFIELKLILKR